MAKSKQNDKLVVTIKLTIGQPDNELPGTFGKGTASLLRGVEKYGSLNKAAKELRMAYSKAWRLVKEAEGHVGTDLLSRHGAHGSVLTDTGKKLLEIYTTIEQETTKLANDRFEELI